MESGKRIALQLDKLCASDQQWVRDQTQGSHASPPTHLQTSHHARPQAPAKLSVQPLEQIPTDTHLASQPGSARGSRSTESGVPTKKPPPPSKPRPSAFRTFTNRQGRQRKLKFIRADADKLYVETAHGRHVVMAIDKFSDADVEWIRQQPVSSKSASPKTSRHTAAVQADVPKSPFSSKDLVILQSGRAVENAAVRLTQLLSLLQVSAVKTKGASKVSLLDPRWDQIATDDDSCLVRVLCLLVVNPKSNGLAREGPVSLPCRALLESVHLLLTRIPTGSRSALCSIMCEHLVETIRDILANESVSGPEAAEVLPLLVLITQDCRQKDIPLPQLEKLVNALLWRLPQLDGAAFDACARALLYLNRMAPRNRLVLRGAQCCAASSRLASRLAHMSKDSEPSLQKPLLLLVMQAFNKSQAKAESFFSSADHSVLLDAKISRVREVALESQSSHNTRQVRQEVQCLSVLVSWLPYYTCPHRPDAVLELLERLAEQWPVANGSDAVLAKLLQKQLRDFKTHLHLL